MTTKHPSPNDQRSSVKDHNQKALEADVANRLQLGHITPQEAEALLHPKEPAPTKSK